MKSLWSLMGWIGFGATLTVAAWLGHFWAVFFEVERFSTSLVACDRREAFFAEFDPTTAAGQAEWLNRHQGAMYAERAQAMARACEAIRAIPNGLRLEPFPAAPGLDAESRAEAGLVQ